MKTDSFYLTGETVAPAPLHYRACGLEGIYILNGYTVEEHDGERHFSVTDIEGLHKAIGRHLVLHRKALTPREIRFLRNTMDMTQAELAKVLGNNSQSVARWEKGDCEIPGTAEKLLRAIYLASLMTEDELRSLRELLVSQLDELDSLDEVAAAPAQFELLEHWEEREREMA